MMLKPSRLCGGMYPLLSDFRVAIELWVACGNCCNISVTIQASSKLEPNGHKSSLHLNVTIHI